MNAQFTAVPTPAINMQTLAQKLAGKGIIITNPSLVCPNGAAASFTALSTTLGLDSGIVLTTGNVLTYTSGSNTNYGINGAASLSAKTDNLTVGGDADLATSAGQPQSFLHDMCKLEFDFVPLSDTLKLNYKFASEEYPEYNCTQFNDVFGLYISGPGYATPTNIALVPGTTIPVSVNSVNDGTTSFFGNITNCTSLGAGAPFTALYTNNAASSSIVYDGFTNLFQARAVVTPCSTYHFKIAIADLGDGDRDSGLFLKAGSFTSDAATIDFVTNASNLVQTAPYVMEGCSSAVVQISRPVAKTIPITVGISGSGTAQSGVDYTMPSSVIIPANATTATFNVTAINDAITEGTEIIKVYIYGSICSTIPTDSINISILEYPKYSISNNDTICLGQSANLLATSITSPNLLTYTWTPGNFSGASQNVSPLVTTTYTVAANHPGCVKRDSLVTITVAPLPTVNAGLDKSLCSASQVALSATVGPTAPYTATYVWNPSNSLSNATILVPNAAPLITTTYTLTVTTSAGCTSTDAVVVNVAPPIVSSAAISNALCNGASSGTATVTATGTTGVVTYLLQPSNITNTTGIFSNLAANTYTCTITNAAGCTKTQTFIINQGPLISFNNPSFVAPACNGQNNGSLSLTAFGGTGAISYNLFPGNILSFGGTYPNLAGGIYSIQATDAQGCTKSTTLTLTQPTILTWSSVSKTNATCNAYTNGVINAGASGGNGGYTYNILPQNISNASGVFNNLAAGNYTVKATDAKGCSTTSVVIITQPAGMNFNAPTITAPSCNPGNNGSFTITATGGLAPVTYNISPIGTTNSSGAFTALGIGAFVVTATDGSGCTKTTVVNLSYANAPSFSSVINVGVNCFGQNNGSINAIASGGIGAVTYTLNPGAVSNATGSYPNLTAGVYTIIARDANLCTTVSTVTVTTPATLAISSNLSNGPLCNGAANGNINLTMSGGTPVYNFVLSPGGITNTSGLFNNINIGNYTMNITDAKGCTRSTFFTLTQPAAITWVNNTTSTNILCNGAATGTIGGTASGGTGVINYNILPSNITNTSGAFTNLPAGTYTVKATDANNCTITKTIVLTQPSALNLNISNLVQTTCVPGNNGSFLATATGGLPNYNYLLQNTGATNGTGVFGSLGSGSYIVRVTDANGCTRTTNVSLPVTPAPTITNFMFVQPIQCGIDSSDSLQVVVLGVPPFSYTLQPINTTNSTGFFNNLSAGTYTAVVTDGNGCTAASSIVISLPLELDVFVFSVTQPQCANNLTGSIDINASGGIAPYTFNNLSTGASNSTGIFLNLGAGTFQIEGVDAVGCKDTIPINITIPPPLAWTTVTFTNLLCNGINNGTINTIASGGTGIKTYTLNPGNITNAGSFTGLSAGSYTVIARDINNCSITTIITLTQPSAITLSSPNITSPTCQAPTTGAISFSASGGTGALIYSIGSGNNSTGVFTNLTANTYTLSATDANGCTRTTQAFLIIPNAPYINNVAKTNISCIGNTNGSFAVTMAGGSAPYSYSYNGGTYNFTNSYSNLAVGNYTMTMRDANNCTVSTVIAIANPLPLTFAPSVVANVLCNAAATGSIQQTVNGGTGTKTFTLLPSTSNTTGSFVGLIAGTYTIQVVDANNCSSSSTVQITQATPIIFSNPTLTNPTCLPNNNGAISITASGGTGTKNYTLLGVGSNGTGNFVNLLANTYTLSIQDASNCTRTTTIILITPNAPSFSSVTKTNLACFGGNTGVINVVASGGTGAKNYTLFPGSVTNTTGIFSNLVSTTYTIQASDAAGCSITSTTNLSQPTQILFSNITTNPPLCNIGSTANLIASANGGTGSLSYTLTPSNITNTTGVFNSIAANTYTVNAIDANTCSVTTTATIIAPTPLIWSNFNIVNVLCRNASTGIISCLANGGTGAISYTLQPNNIIVTNGGFGNLTAGTYTVIAQDANNCSTSSTVNITQPLTSVAINNSSNTIPTCVPGNDAILTVNATGGTGVLGYQLNNGLSGAAGTITGVGVGNFTLTVTDANGCTSTKTIVINNPNAPIPSNVVLVAPTCNGGNNGSISLSATGGTGSISYLLQPGLVSSTTGVFNNLISQNYTITVTDNIGCANNTNIILTQPSLITFNATTITSALCFGATGNISLAGIGGTGALTYNIQPINLTNTSGVFNNVPANTYTAIATDASGCTQSTFVSVATPPVLYWFAFNTNTVSCNGGGNGLIAVNARGGTGTINYTVNPGNLSDTIGFYPNLPAAIYTIIVTDANGCTISSTVNISQPPALSYGTLNATVPTCVPGNDATLTSIASGGVGGFVYSLNGAAFVSSGTYNNLGAGVYTITVRDNNNCTYSQTTLIANPGAPNINSINLITPSCFGFSNGSITTNLSGGTGLITYTLLPINSSNNTGSYSNLIAQNYTLSISDAANCTVSSVINITQPATLQYTLIDNNPPLCNNGTNGLIAHATSGGTGIITFTLQPGNTSTTNDTSFNKAAGTYTINAVDTRGCATTATTTLLNPALLQFNNPSITHPNCNGANNGIISYNAIGGTGILNYTLQNIGTQNNSGIFTNIAGPATYTVQVIDANNCSRSSIINITQPTAMNLNLVSITGASCSPGGDGTASVTCTGGTGILNYTITDGIATLNGVNGLYNNLSNTTYTVIVLDANSCTATDIIQLVAPNSPNITSVIASPASCVPNNNGSVTVTANQGTPTYTFKLNNGAFQVANIFAGLTANTYTVTVQDSKGCSSTSTINVSTTPNVILGSNTFSSITCFGLNNGTISASGTTGLSPYSFTISPTNATNSNGQFNNLSPATYTLTISDANGCTTTATNAITQPAVLTLSTITPTPPLCFNGSNGLINAATSGGTGTKTFVLNNGLSTNTTGNFTGLLGNATYTISVTDANGCSSSNTVFISQPTPMIFGTLSKIDLTCNGALNGSITASASGGIAPITYSLTPTGANNTTGIFNNLNGNIYTVVASDANNCITTSTINVIEPAAITVTNNTIIPVSCFNAGDGSINISGNGGVGTLSYTLQPGSIITGNGQYQNLAGNTYTVYITDANNCSISTTSTVAEPNELLITNIAIINNICAGNASGSAVITTIGGNGNNNYSTIPIAGVSTGNSITSLPANSYTISVIDNKGCSSTTLIAVTEPPALLLQLDSIKNLTCNAGSNGFLQTSASGGIGNYLFTILPGNGNNTTGDFINLTVGNYSIIVTDANNCTSQLNNLIISEPTPITFDTFSKKNVQCYSNVNGKIYAQATGGGGTFVYTLLPNNSSNITGLFDSLQFGTYTLQVADTIGCIKDTIIQIEQNSEISLLNVTYKNPTCFGASNGSISFTAIGGVAPLAFSFNNSAFSSDTFYQNLGSGAHFIKMIDSLNCTNDTTLFLQQPDSLEFILDSLEDVYCFPQKTGKIFVHAEGGNDLSYTYILSPVNKINNDGAFTNLGLGTYTIFVKDSLGCTNSKIVTLVESNFKMQPTITTTPINCKDGFANGTALVTVSSGYPPYTFAWSNLDSAALADSLQYGEHIVFITDSVGCTISDTTFIDPSTCCEVYIPNAFSPNNDDNNEKWTPISSGTIENYYLIIFDRWGNRVFNTIQMNESWDGTYKGAPLDVDTYFYLLTYRCAFDNQKRVLKGDIMLVK